MSLLKDLLDQNIKAFGEYPFLYYGDRVYSNVETQKLAIRIASGLRNSGIEKGDRVLVCMPNCPEVLFSYQGITRAGAIIVPVLYLLHAHEIKYIIQNSKAKAVITNSDTLPKINEAIRSLSEKPRIFVSDDPDYLQVDNLHRILDEYEERNFTNIADVGEHDPAVILYTSGTTGKPKGVILTHKNLYSNAVSSAAVRQETREITIGVLPLAHVYGLTLSNICYIKGNSIVVFSKFDAEKVFQAIETYKVSSFSVVPAMVYAMFHHPKSEKYNLSSLKTLSSGSAPLPEALRIGFKEKLNVDVLEGYGLSEAAPVVASQRDDMPYKPGSVGVPIPGVEIKIVDPNDVEVSSGEIGELLVRGDNVTPGYYENEEETARVIKNSWLYTGDLAKVDVDGYLFIVDRKKDLIIRGGFNIYPRDLEELLSRHSSVLETAVIGVPDERMGEEVLAFVVKKPEDHTTEEELIHFCQQHLAKNKTPRNIVFLDSLPRNGVGKILKTQLRKWAKEQNYFRSKED